MDLYEQQVDAVTQVLDDLGLPISRVAWITNREIAELVVTRTEQIHAASEARDYAHIDAHLGIKAA